MGWGPEAREGARRRAGRLGQCRGRGVRAVRHLRLSGAQTVASTRYTESRVRETKTETDSLRQALERQEDGEVHDRSLIVERLAWTPEQRLEANAAFLRFYLSIRPEGPLVREE